MDININAEALIADIQKEALQIERRVSKAAAEKTKTVLSKAYDDIIDQYYLYKTTSYYRHATGIGTGTGWNLYQSNNISLYPKAVGENDKYTGLIFDINANDMAGYPRFSKHKVLDNVLQGIRGVPGSFSWLLNKKNNRMMTMIQRETSFSAKIKVEKDSFSGSPNQILDSIIAKVPKYYENFWTRAWNRELKYGNYTYFQKRESFNYKARKK